MVHNLVLLTNDGCMYNNRFFLAVCIVTVFIFLQSSSAASKPRLLAVVDIASNGTISKKICRRISDTVSAVISRDSSCVQFDRSMLPELMKQLSVEESMTSCSDPQCLLLIGNLIGADFVIGGFVRYKDRLTQIELNLISVSKKRALNTVTMSTGSGKRAFFRRELPLLVGNLLNPDAPPPPSKLVADKRNIFTRPIFYISTLLVGGAASGAYLYMNGDLDQYLYKTDTPEPEPSLFDNLPARGE